MFYPQFNGGKREGADIFNPNLEVGEKQHAEILSSLFSGMGGAIPI